MPPRESCAAEYGDADHRRMIAAQYHRDRRAAATPGTGDHAHALGLRAYQLFTAIVGVTRAD